MDEETIKKEGCVIAIGLFFITLLCIMGVWTLVKSQRHENNNIEYHQNQMDSIEKKLDKLLEQKNEKTK